MLLAWMTYAVLVATLAAGAALVAERLLPLRARWVWAGALAVGWGTPLARAALERWVRADAGLTVVFGPVAPVMDAALGNLAAIAGSPSAARLASPLAALWIASSSLLFLVVAAGWLRMRLQARRWTPTALEGSRVLVSDDVGPAVVGVLRPAIVVPRWVQELPAEERRLILAHEEEHRRKRDPALLAGALLMPLLTPWNPLVWFSFFRLRGAVEVDCDARVLALDAGSAVGYARLLFQVGTTPGRPVPLGAGFGERRSGLERRIRAMLEEKTKGRAGEALVRGVLAASLVLVACSLEVNVELAGADENAPAVAEAPAATGETLVPAAPPKATASAGETEVPAAGSGGETKVTVPPPPSPMVREPVPESRAGAKKGEELAAAPTFTPFTVAPSILNRDAVIQAMEREYPPLLREAGIGGTVRMYFFIDETGLVKDTRIDTSSGHQALDDAALRVASIYRFEPALNRDEKVPVWVSFPITFRMR